MEELKIWSILFFCIAIQGLFLAFLIVSRKNKSDRGHHFFLGSFISLFSVILIFWVGHWNQFIQQDDIYTFIYRPLPLLLGPLAFFYVKSFFQKISVDDWTHCIPFMLIVLYFTPAYIDISSSSDLSEYLWNWDRVAYFFSYLNTASVIFYSIYLVYFFKQKMDISDTKLKIVTLRIIKMTILFFCAFSFFAFVNLWVRMNMNAHPIAVDMVLAFLICLFIYGMGYLGFNMPNSVHSVNAMICNTYSRSKLNTTDVKPLLHSILRYIEDKRPYLQEGYQLSHLSRETNIASHHISELLNKYHNKSFSEVINEFRIEEAKKLLHSKDFRHMKIESIAFEVGFNSSSTFYTWFKKLTGTSPSDYQKKLV